MFHLMSDPLIVLKIKSGKPQSSHQNKMLAVNASAIYEYVQISMCMLYVANISTVLTISCSDYICISLLSCTAVEGVVVELQTRMCETAF